MNLSDVNLILCPLNYNGTQHVSHTGLAVSAMNTARYLRSKAVKVQVNPVRTKADILALISQFKPSHIVVNALWLPTADLAAIVHGNPSVHFAILVHSNIAFLQVEPKGIQLLREAVDLELSALGNFNVAANSRAGVQGMQDAWECPALYLPNLYFLDSTVRVTRHKWSGGTLRIGAFGALRPLKNPTASAFASLAIATNLGTNLEFHVNSGRNDGGWAARLLASIQAIFQNLPYAKLVQDPWSPWAEFRRNVRNMHLLLQPSFTESFNVVTADGVAEGVPSVVSDVIEWAPEWWKAPADNTEAIARTGRCLLSDSHTGQDGVNALSRHNEDGFLQWSSFLQSKLV